MSMQRSPYVPIALKIFADAVMAALALTAALLTHVLAGVANGGGAPSSIVSELVGTLAVQIPLLIVPMVAIYALWGVYGRVRGLAATSKMVHLAGAATLSFVIFGLLQRPLPSSLALSVDVIIGALALEIVALAASRYWSTTWRTLAVAEAGLSRLASRNDGRKRVLVIGGAGYIGSALLPHLLEKGYRVRVLDLLLFGEDPIKPVLDHPDLEIVRADFRQVDRAVAAMKDVDMVVHLGGLVGDPACSVDAGLTTEVNLDYTRVIAEIAKGEGVKRFVFASSCSVYGASDEVLDETSLLNPVSLYARSKIASENVLFEMSSPDFAPTMLRFGTIYGLSGRLRFDLVVNLLSAKAVIDNKITVFGGDQWRPFLHVEDAARSVMMVLEAPTEVVRNEIFNVGSDEQNATLGDIGRLVQRFVPEAEYIDSGHDGDRRNYRVDFSKIRQHLGFQPAWTLEAGVQQVVEAVRSGKVRDYRDPMYSNVRFLVDNMAPRYSRVRKDWANRRIEGDVTRSSKGQADARLAIDVEREAAQAAAGPAAIGNARPRKVVT